MKDFDQDKGSPKRLQRFPRSTVEINSKNQSFSLKMDEIRQQVHTLPLLLLHTLPWIHMIWARGSSSCISEHCYIGAHHCPSKNKLKSFYFEKLRKSLYFRGSSCFSGILQATTQSLDKKNFEPCLPSFYFDEWYSLVFFWGSLQDVMTYDAKIWHGYNKDTTWIRQGQGFYM